MNTITLSAQRLSRYPNESRSGVHRSGGAIAGVVGGLAMTASAMLLAGWYGYDIWVPLKAIAGIVLGPSAIAQIGFVAGPVVVGLLIHLGLSALLGALFGMVTRDLLRLPSDYGVPAVVGLVFGLMLWLAAFLIAPALIPQLMAIAAPAFMIQHIVFGTVTGVVHALLRPQPYAMTA
jgi:hypothetical protein